MSEISYWLQDMATGPMSQNPEHADTCNSLIEAAAEIESLEQWVRDCQSGMYINCVYCGHRYGPREDTPVSMADVLKQHIATCPKHPMSKLLSACKGAVEISDLWLRGGNWDEHEAAELDSMMLALTDAIAATETS